MYVNKIMEEEVKEVKRKSNKSIGRTRERERERGRNMEAKSVIIEKQIGLLIGWREERKGDTHTHTHTHSLWKARRGKMTLF